VGEEVGGLEVGAAMKRRERRREMVSLGGLRREGKISGRV